MATVMTEWQSTKPNPDEDYLKALWQAEIKSSERALAKAESLSRKRQANIMPLLKGSGLSQADIAKRLKENADLSRKSLKEIERELAKPPLDFTALHKQDLELAKANAKRIEEHNPSWSGVIWNANYAGAWWSWNGESEEVPAATFRVDLNRFDPRSQAWGEGWWDGDWSRLHGYMAFQFTPPSWGHLHIYTYPWLHGYYCLYSNDEWWNSEYARTELDTWVDVYQNFWRGRQYRRRFTLAGDELHPERCGRIDSQYSHAYYTNVGAGDTVTIRVGAQLYSYARASGGRSRLNFQAGAANYIYVPYVHWYLHH